MVNLNYQEKLLLYTYISREFPQVIVGDYPQTEGELDKALLSFLETIKDNPWEYFKDDFIKVVDKQELLNTLYKMISNIERRYGWGNSAYKTAILQLLNNMVKFTEEKQKDESKAEELMLSEKDKKLKAILAKVEQLEKEGKI